MRATPTATTTPALPSFSVRTLNLSKPSVVLVGTAIRTPPAMTHDPTIASAALMTRPPSFYRRRTVFTLDCVATRRIGHRVIVEARQVRPPSSVKYKLPENELPVNPACRTVLFLP